MEHVADAQARPRFEIADPVQHLRQPGARHDAVLHVVVRRDAAHRRERRLAPLPDPRALLVGLARPRSSSRRGAGRSRSTIVEELAHFGGRTIELDDQHGVGGGKIRMHRRFGRADRERDPSSRPPPARCRRAMMSETPRRRRRSCRTRRAASAPLSGRRRIRTVTLRDDRQRALRIRSSTPSRSGPGVSASGAAELHQLAVGQDRFDAEHVVHGEAVLQAVRAAGVLGDVAADRADLLARRIGRVVVAERRHLPRDLEVGDAGLDRDALVGDVDVEHAVEPRQRDHERRRRPAARRPTGRCRARARRTARRSRAHSRTTACTSAADCRQHDGRRRRAQVRQRVGLIGQQLERIVEDVPRRRQSPQFASRNARSIACCPATRGPLSPQNLDLEVASRIPSGAVSRGPASAGLSRSVRLGRTLRSC